MKRIIATILYVILFILVIIFSLWITKSIWSTNLPEWFKIWLLS
jgi:uncharacterized protein YxeA